jgi:hypothetical protein
LRRSTVFAANFVSGLQEQDQKKRLAGQKAITITNGKTFWVFLPAAKSITP